MNTLRKGLFAMLALSLPLGALAASTVEIDDDHVRVSFADLDIYEEVGAKVLYSRLQRASRAACNVESLTTLGSIERTTAAKTCYSDMLDEFVTRIDSEALKKIHAG